MSKKDGKKTGNIVVDGTSYTIRDYNRKLKRDKKRAVETQKKIEKKLKEKKSHQDKVSEVTTKK